ncbi:hypothetical protein QFZ39_001636 [Paraburkholderia graminis]|nr:hypothetical protein [Paraburkholderia graminis]
MRECFDVLLVGARRCVQWWHGGGPAANQMQMGLGDAACNRRHCASATRSAALHLIQREIQLQHVHAPLAEHA